VAGRSRLEGMLGWSGRMIAGSKSGYHRQHPDHVVVFNAGICVERGGLPELIWEGDLDLTLDEEPLVAFAGAYGETLHIVFEGDRPDGFYGPRAEALTRAVLVIDPDGRVSFDERRIKRDADARLLLDLDRVEIESLRSQVAALRGRCDRLDALVRRGVEQGWLTQSEHEAALWFPEVGG
jgi:hypothetical protein